MANCAELQTVREKSGLSRRQVAEAVCRSGEWLRLVEIGERPETPAIRAAILEAIERLSQFRSAERELRQNLLADLRLPRNIRTSSI